MVALKQRDALAAFVIDIADYSVGMPHHEWALNARGEPSRTVAYACVASLCWKFYDVRAGPVQGINPSVLLFLPPPTVALFDFTQVQLFTMFAIEWL